MSGLEIILGISFLYSVHTILYKRKTCLTYSEMFTLFCIFGWISLVLEYLYERYISRNQSSTNPIPPKDPDEWDGTVIYPGQQK